MKRPISILTMTLIWTCILPITGCSQLIIDYADREVYQLIKERQKASIGASSNVFVGKPSHDISVDDRMYRFNPRPVVAGIPESFRNKKNSTPAQNERNDKNNSDLQTDHKPVDVDVLDPLVAKTNSIFSEEQQENLTVFGLSNALAYANRHGRTMQDAKEDLYFATLDLTLERHLWTPQFVANMSAEYNFVDAGGLQDEDNAFTTIMDFAVSQRLPHGGVLTAQIVSTLVQDLKNRVVAGENGDVILGATIPLFRGAGEVAYESRYIAERELIYAVRRYERFRRSYLVRIASDYFNLQQLRTAIDNAFQAYKNLKSDWEKADFINQVGRSQTIFDAPRAKSSLRNAESTLISSKERYASALDQFKILVGMSVEEWLDVLDQDADKDARAVDDLLSEVSDEESEKAALTYRLDLLNSADSVDDMKRGVQIAKNRLLPDLDFSGNFIMESDPDHANSIRFNPERGSWRAGFNFRMDDRKTEQNDYRRRVINLRRSRRDHELFVDGVRADVRRAIRRIIQQKNLLTILRMNVKENEFRAAAARAQFDLGKSTNQDVVDAEDVLLRDRNNIARAVAAYWVAVLEFRLSTGTLRITDEGHWGDDALVQPAGP